MKIRASTLEFIVQAAANAQPREFLGLLRARQGVVSEVLIIPGSRFGHGSCTLAAHMVPLDPGIVGSVHSHPSSARPSRADLAFFSSHGKLHLIVDGRGRVFAFDNAGQPTNLEIVK